MEGIRKKLDKLKEEKEAAEERCTEVEESRKEAEARAETVCTQTKYLPVWAFQSVTTVSW